MKKKIGNNYFETKNFRVKFDANNHFIHIEADDCLSGEKYILNPYFCKFNNIEEMYKFYHFLGNYLKTKFPITQTSYDKMKKLLTRNTWN